LHLKDDRSSRLSIHPYLLLPVENMVAARLGLGWQLRAISKNEGRHGIPSRSSFSAILDFKLSAVNGARLTSPSFGRKNHSHGSASAIAL
jgi:hypothetical protein